MARQVAIFNFFFGALRLHRLYKKKLRFLLFFPLIFLVFTNPFVALRRVFPVEKSDTIPYSAYSFCSCLHVASTKKQGWRYRDAAGASETVLVGFLNVAERTPLF